MLSSRGEIKIHEILEMNDINFVEEYSFPDLISSSGRPLRFDFAIFDEDGELAFLIEYQGIQHYEPKPKFGGVRGLWQQKYNDGQKKKYCALHNIILVEIPYWEEGLVNFDYIMEKSGYV